MASVSSTRLLKNTIYMYVRMLIVMLVSLYTSRIMLQALGVSNFGVYNAIAGFIVLLSFLNSGLSIITQRNIAYALESAQSDVNLVYSISIRIHVIIVFIVCVLAETIGLWFINVQMKFPEGLNDTINWLYQLSLLSAFVNILKVPTSALIISHEKMSFYAWTSILEVILKVLIVYVLFYADCNKLVLYGALLLAINIIMLVWQSSYCKRNFKTITYTKQTDKRIFKQIVTLSGWTFFGSFASICCQQGDNLIINIFFGVLFNASVGIANQVNGALTQLVSGFQQALNPQLVKSEASHNTNEQCALLYTSTKLSFIIMFVFAVPVVFNIDTILQLWLNTIPPDTAVICKLIIYGALVEAISGPIWMTIYANGNIKKYQIVISGLFMLELPIAYCIARLGYSIAVIFSMRIILYIILLATRLYFLKYLIGFSIKGFLTAVICRLVGVFVAIHALAIAYNVFFNVGTSLPYLATSVLIWMCITASLCYYIGLNSNERNRISSMIFSLKTKLSSRCVQNSNY